MKFKDITYFAALFMILAAIFPAAAAGNSPADNSNDTRSLLVMGDSMSGWMGERLNAYGQTNGFEVATIVWDGSTIRKWGDAKARIREYMEDFNPFEGVQGVNELLADILKNVQSSAEDTSKIADGLERDKEDLEFLRTVANIKYGDKYVMPQVKVEMTNNNNIQSDMDLDGFFDRKVEEMAQIITASAEGVHI